MSLSSRLLARAAWLSQPRHRDVEVERGIGTEMPDGVVLRADRWWSPSAGRGPVVLMRTPYGTRPFSIFGRLFAERGYQVVIQSCRGTHDSGGEFTPFRNEARDGAATLAWIAQQEWFGASIAMYGPSYLGIVQWAAASELPAALGALSMQVTASDPHRSVVFPGGSFSLETGAFWVNLILSQRRSVPGQVMDLLNSRRRLSKACAHLPLESADVAGLGERVPFYREWLDHEGADDPWWDSVDFTRAVGSLPPCSLVAGWYDLFLAGQLEDYRRLVDAGREARLTVGPWTHVDPA